MKKYLLLFGILVLSISPLFAQETSGTGPSYGLLFMGGIRYDDVRMCVATEAGVPGGPMADVQLVMRWELSPDKTLAFNLPVTRPILFFAAFDMIQFEPEVNLEFHKTLKSGTRIVTGPGLGLSFHLGPDYESSLSSPNETFTAFGPVFSWKWAIALNPDKKHLKTIGGKLFYTPLFATNHANGNVIGLAVEYQVGF